MEVCFSLDNPKREISTIRGYISYSGQRYDFPTGESVKVKMFRGSGNKQQINCSGNCNEKCDTLLQAKF